MNAFDLRLLAEVHRKTVRYTFEIWLLEKSAAELEGADIQDPEILEFDAEMAHAYDGKPDFSRPNLWVASEYEHPRDMVNNVLVHPNAELNPNYFGFSNGTYTQFPNVIHFGVPYRKEISIEDMGGNYQKGWFQVRGGKVVAIDDHYGTAGFWLNTYDPHAQVKNTRTHVLLHLGMNIQDMFKGDAEEAMNNFYHETYA